MEDALVVALAGLRLRQVLGRQGDGFHHAHRDVDLGGGQDLGAVLQGEQGADDERGTLHSLPQHPQDPPWAGRLGNMLQKDHSEHTLE